MESKHGYTLSVDGSDNRLDSNYNKNELKMGIKVEFEHTTQKELAKSIAKDHLDELPDYYSRLKIMEEEGGKGTTPKDLDNLMQ
jgi:hypothetical protein